jgi:nicotinamide-nucleotide amidase
LFVEKSYPKHVYGYKDEKLVSVLGGLLIENKYTLGTIESCTAGKLASELVSIPGSSAYFSGSILSYSNELKVKLVGVNKKTIEKNGAVSQEVVEQMATNGIKILGVDYCISTSGIAGPDGGTDEKPVGTIWIGIASKGEVWSKKFNFAYSRKNNIESTVNYAMNYLRQIVLGIND